MEHENLKVSEFKARASHYIRKMSEGKVYLINGTIIGEVKNEVETPTQSDKRLDDILKVVQKVDHFLQNNEKPRIESRPHLVHIEPQTPTLKPLNTIEEIKSQFEPTKTNEDLEYLKLSGQAPLGINEYIDYNSGEICKYECEACHNSKTQIRINPEGFYCCLNCAPSERAFNAYKIPQQHVDNTIIDDDVVVTKSKSSVQAVPKPVFKKKKKQ